MNDPKFHVALRALKLFLQHQEDLARRGLAPPGLSPAEAQALIHLGENPGQRQSDLATALAIVPTTASSLVARLTKRNLVQSLPMAEDGRAVSLSLTPAGADVFDLLDRAMVAASAQVYDAVPDGLRDDFRDTLVQTITKLRLQSDGGRI
ncbi:MAG: MarR family transcriptional regulator [Pseudomonadota bacterium]